MTHEQFLDTTSSQLNALMKRHKIAVQQSDYRAGLIASILYNSNRGSELPARTAASFFDSLTEFEEGEEKATVKEKVMDADAQLNFLEALFGKAPGR